MIHNASIEKYRAPIGAVEKGEDITLRLFGLPKNTDSVDVIYYSENFHRELRMKQRGDCCEKVITMPEECCIIWYYFRIWEADHCYFYGAKPGVTQGE